MKEIKVFLVDNQEIFREGLARLLQEQPRIQVVNQCENHPQMVEQIQATTPDILLIDADITHTEIFHSLQQIRRISPATRIALFTNNCSKDPFCLAMQMGARGYLSKDVPMDELVASISLIARGEIVVSPRFSEPFLFAALRATSPTVGLASRSTLSLREVEVLNLVTSGATNREIAQKLYIAVNTVKVHLKNILDKLQLRNRQQLAVYAVKQGLTNRTTQMDSRGGDVSGK
jgi:DNA-binding NarL/FixJ family response regulator